jgi:Leu/Phe-tRNA-protein transferase
MIAYAKGTYPKPGRNLLWWKNDHLAIFRQNKNFVHTLTVIR